MGLFDQANDLKLLGGGVSHSSSPPSAIMLFKQAQFERLFSHHRLKLLRFTP
jgi:hypothetical protein